MSPDKNSKILPGIVIASSALLVAILVYVAVSLLWASRTDPATGLTNVSFERAAFFCAQYIAGPLGITVLLSGIFSRRKKLKAVGILTGLLGIIIGSLTWVWLIMVSSIVW